MSIMLKQIINNFYSILFIVKSNKKMINKNLFVWLILLHSISGKCQQNSSKYFDSLRVIDINKCLIPNENFYGQLNFLRNNEEYFLSIDSIEKKFKHIYSTLNSYVGNYDKAMEIFDKSNDSTINFPFVLPYSKISNFAPINATKVIDIALLRESYQIRIFA